MRGGNKIYLIFYLTIILYVFFINSSYGDNILSYDVNADNQKDIIWRNPINGDIYLWLMNTKKNMIKALDLKYNIRPISDLNNDGKDDLILKNTLTEELSVWLMDGINPPLKISNTNFATYNLDTEIINNFDWSSNYHLLLKNKSTDTIYLWLENMAPLPSIPFTFSCNKATEIMFSEYADFKNSSWEPYIKNKSITLSNGNGQKTIYTKFKNAFGEELNGTPVTIIVNTTLPKVNILSPKNNFFTKQSTISMQGSIDKICFDVFVNGKQPEITDFSFAADMDLQEGENAIYTVAIDLNGNISNFSEITVTSDTLPPQNPTIAILEGEYTKDLHITLNLSAKSATEMIISEDKSFSEATWEPYQTDKQIELSPNEGIKTIYVKYQDALGNISSSVTDSIILDQTAPIITINTPRDNSFTKNSSIAITGTIDEPCSEFSINEEAQLLNETNLNKSIDLPKQGENTITLAATDLAGNQSMTSLTVNLNTWMSKCSPSGEEIYRINCGAKDFDYTNPSTGNWWCKDEYFYSLWRWGYIGGNSSQTTNPILVPQEIQPIYQSSRWGSDMSYKIEVPDGDYELKLMFTESWFNEAGKRVFDVAVEGNTIWQAVDIYKQAGGKNIPLELESTVTISDKCLDITFPLNSITDVDQPSICGIELKTKNVSDDAVLDFIQKKFFWLFWNAAHQKSGLVKWGADNWEENYVNVSSSAITGFALSIYTIGAKRAWITKEMAYDRTMKILNKYDQLQKSNLDYQSLKGFWYHWVYMGSINQWDFIDIIAEESKAWNDDQKFSFVNSLFWDLSANDYIEVTDTEKSIGIITEKFENLTNVSQFTISQNYADKKETIYDFIKRREVGSRADNSEISTVDSALFILGAIQAGEYFKKIPSQEINGKDPLAILAKAETLYKNMDWAWFTDWGYPTFINMGWKPTISDWERDNNQYFLLNRAEGGYFCNDWWNRYSEALFVYFLAQGSPTYAPNNDNRGFKEMRRKWAQDYDNVYNEPWWPQDQVDWVNNSLGYHFIQEPPLFVHQYHHFYYDLTDRFDPFGNVDYFDNSRKASLANYLTSKESSHLYEENIWGLTACGGPDTKYHIYGSKPGGGHDGTVAPSAAITSIMFTPEESIKAARYMYFQYKHKIWGRYGFVDSFNLVQDWRHWAIEGLNHGAMIIAIENYRSGLVKNTFMQNTLMKNSLDAVGLISSPDVSASSYGTDSMSGTKAFDDDSGTRWATIPDPSAPQWLEIDFKSPRNFNKISINWEAAYASTYQIQISDNRMKWTTIYKTNSSDGTIDEIQFDDNYSSRYLRIYLTEAATSWGYSIWEVAVLNE